MAAVTSSPSPHLCAIPSASASRTSLRESIALPSFTARSVLNMNSEASSPSPLHAYPEPRSSDAHMSGGSEYLNTGRPHQPPLSQEDQNLANSLSHGMNGHMNVLTPQLTNGQPQGFGIGAQSGLSQTPQQKSLGASIASQHSGVDPNQDLSYGIGTDRRKRSKVSRACDECRRKKVGLGTPPSFLRVDNLAQVRCDSTISDSNVIETCSNCRRLKSTCQFERAPMKRGPSKGYAVPDPQDLLWWLMIPGTSRS